MGTTSAMDQDEELTVAGAARRLGISIETLLIQFRKDGGPGYRLVGEGVRIRIRDLEEWKAERDRRWRQIVRTHMETLSRKDLPETSIGPER